MKFTISIFFLLSSVACLAAGDSETYLSELEAIHLSQLNSQQIAENGANLAGADSQPFIAPNPFLNVFSLHSAIKLDQLVSDGLLGIGNLDGQDRHSVDAGIAVGYPLAKSWMFYAGYSDADSDMRYISHNPAIHVDSELYPTDAYYLGGSYQMPLSWPGLLTVNLGYASLDTSSIHTAGKVCELDDEICAGNSFNATQLSSMPSVEQNATISAWTYGVIWLIPVTENMAVNTSLKLNDYQENLGADGKTVSKDQKATFFNLGVQYAF